MFTLRVLIPLYIIRFFFLVKIDFITLNSSALIIFHAFAMLIGFFSLILKMDEKEGVFWSFLFIALEIPVLVLFRV